MKAKIRKLLLSYVCDGEASLGRRKHMSVSPRVLQEDPWLIETDFSSSITICTN